MQFKPRIKPKLLLKKVVALLTATATSLSLATTSLAAGGMTGNGDGDSGGVKKGAYTYALPGYNVSWRADLYVSSNSDGKIDVDNDKIGTSKLPYMGSVYYDNALDNLTYYQAPAKDIWISTDYTAERKSLVDGKQTSQSSGFTTGYSYALPNIAHVDKDTRKFTDSAGHTVAFTNDPSGISCVNMNNMNSARYKTEVQNCIESNSDGTPSAFLTNTIKRVNNVLGGGFTLAKKARGVVGDTPKAKVSDKIADALSSGNTKALTEAYNLLLPTAGKDCVVEWCIVVTPMASWMENEGSGAYWLGYQDGKLTLIGGSDKTQTVLAMDSFMTAQYNRTSRYLYADQSMKNWIHNQGCTTNSKYVSESLFWYEYGASITANIASVAHDTHKEAGSAYCGVATSKDKEQSYWAGNESLMASSGGITVYKNEIEVNDIPVYYYIYDDNNVFVRSVETSIPVGTPTFTPSTEYGVPIHEQEISKSGIMKSSQGNVRYMRYSESDTLKKYLLAEKGDATKWQNPQPITEAIKVPTTVKSIHVKVVQEPTAEIIYHIYRYTVPDDRYDTLKDLSGAELEASGDLAALTPTISVESKPITTAGMKTPYKASSDSTATKYGKLVHVTAILAGKEIGTSHVTCPDNCEPSKDGYTTRKTSSNIYDKVYQVEPSTSISFNNDATNKQTREIHVKIISIQKAPPLDQAAKDRIKSYDLTQLIEDTQQTISSTGGQHLNKTAAGAADRDLDQYNTSKNGIYKGHNDHVSSPTSIGIITSFNNPEATNNAVHASNYLSGTKNPCTVSCSVSVRGSHSSSCYSTDSDRNKSLNCSSHHHHSCGWKCGYNESDCHWLEESVVVVFGKDTPSQKQKSEKTPDGKGVQIKTSWKEPTSSSSPIAWSEVGFAIGGTYYNKNAVVKLHPAGNTTEKTTTSGKSYYLLPKLDSKTALVEKHGIKANEFATFDLLLGESGSTDKYWLRYVDSGDTGVIGTDGFVQYTKFQDSDKEKDWENSQGAGNWDYLSSNQGAKIDGAKFISHRDLLSGDKIASSLVVSGYMAKYGYQAETADYLKFMQNAGFTFSGISGLSSVTGQSNAAAKLKYVSAEDATALHTTRVLDVANELKVSDIKASATGNGNTEYNTSYQGGTKSTLADQYKVRFGLGGIADDGGEIFNKYIQDTNLGDISINTSSGDGDASRSTWYYATYSKGTTASCYDLVVHGHDGHGGSSCCGTHVTHTATNETHSSPHKAALASCLSNNKYVAKNADIFINDMKKSKTHTSADISGGSQTGAISSIVTSRLSFKINLGVEGTIAGVWDATNQNGLNYNSDKLELVSGVLKYKETPASGSDVEKTWRETTVEMVQSHYNNVGSGETTDNLRNSKRSEVLAEFRYSIPTQAFKFNPSYYMQFDKGYSSAEQNQSVWMLSNQPREINFKDILDVRLTQAIDGRDNTHMRDITDACANGYATVINSEWSTDNTDLVVQHATGIPTLKAGNAYTTSTEEQGGSITMYVVLQDPEFVSTDRQDAVKEYNDKVMKSYQETINAILAEMKGMVGNTHAYTARNAADTLKSQMSLAVYTNMENGSSVNSAMQIHGGIEELKDKEPVVINSNGKDVFSYKSRTGVLADVTSPTSANYSNWTYFALKGNTFQAKLNGDKFGEGTGFSSKKDISETATVKGTTTVSSARKITINGSTNVIYSMASKDIPYYITDTLNLYNDRLTGIMSAPQYSVSGSNKSKGTTTVPSAYDPYNDDTSKAYGFDWYGEDYEGFVVAVYNVEFSRYTKDAYKLISGKLQAVTTNGNTTTDQASVYRHESDWKANTNADADLSKYGKTEGSNMHYLVTPDYKISGVENVYASKNTKTNNLEFTRDNKIMLITAEGQQTIKNWSEGKNADGSAADADTAKVLKSTYAEGIYGIGMELANVPIHMKNPVTNKEIGSSDTNVSFFYQPTYFNIRGSVYDTAR